MNQRVTFFALIGVLSLVGLTGCANEAQEGVSKDDSNRFYGASIMGPHRQR